MTKISCDIESDRVAELDKLLGLIKPKILHYIDKADPNSSNYETDSLGKYHSPEF